MSSQDPDSDAESTLSTSSLIAPADFLPAQPRPSPPTPFYRLSLRTTVLLILPLLSLLGGYGTWTLGSSNGTFNAIFALIATKDPKFPGSEDLLVKSYTDVQWLDRQLTILVTFFAPVVDRDQGALTLFSIMGFGQFGAVWTLMVMESMRIGNRRRVVSFIGTVGLILQNISFTVTVPLYLWLHLMTSPVSKPFPGIHANSVLLISPADLRILPISITIGYIVPSLLMTLDSPSIVSPATHQYFIAFWQAFPLWTVLSHWFLKALTQCLSARIYGRKPNGSRPTSPPGQSYLSNARHVYRFVLALCITTHAPIFLLSLLPPYLIPSSFPTIRLFATETPFSIYIPYFPLPSNQVSSLAEGVHTFLIWDLYVGSFAFLCWAVLLYRNATTEKAIVDPNTSLPIYRELLVGERIQDGMQWRKLVGKVGVWWVVGGPVGALAILLWERDAIVRLKIKQGI